MKSKYIFDYETLTFKKATFSLKNFISKIWINVLITISGGVILGLILFNTIKSPYQKQLEQENQMYVFKLQKLDNQFDKLYYEISSIAQKDENIYRGVLGLNPIPEIYKNNYYGGAIKYQRLENYPNKDLLKKLYAKSDLINFKIITQAKSFNEIAEVVSDRERMINATPSIIPIPRNKLIRIGSKFGMRFHPILHIWRLHAGIDLTSPRGTPVYATADGIVIRADAASRGYGKHVKIAHGYGYMTVYAHLSKILVKPGQKVKRGQLIGLVGSTGLSTRPHLHYEVRINNKPVNPINFFYNDLSDEQYQEIIKRAESDK